MDSYTLKSMSQLLIIMNILIIESLLIFQIEEAKVMYHSIHSGSFNFEHCWNTLRFHPKWKRTMSEGVLKKKSLVQEPSCTADSVHLRDDNVSPSVVVNLERPIGNNAKKRERRHERGKTICL
jgi:hypothetical protein